MNDDSDPCVRAHCSVEDEHHKEFVFPRSVIDASTTAGRHEVIRFRSRLEAARHAINLNPNLKSSFGRLFQPLVFKAAYLLIVSDALQVLIEKLAAAGHVLLEDARLACQKYPYLKLSRESFDTFTIEPVEEAISIEGMAFELQKIIGSPLENLLSQDAAANWGMSHILAWTLADCADQEHLRNQLVALPPDQADDAIWKRAWCGEDFRRYFAQAVHYLSSEIAHFVLDAIELKIRNVREIETLIGLRSSGYYLTIASDAARGSHPMLQWATTKYAGLLSSEALSVADTLREGAWRNFSDERSRRRFIHEEAKRRVREFEFIVLNGTGLPGMPTYSRESWTRCGVQAFAAGKDVIMRMDAPDFSAIADSFNTVDAMNAMISLREAIIANDLSLDAQRVLYARIEGHTREDAHEALRIPKTRVAAGWRELNREKGALLKLLSPFPPPNCTLQ